MEVLDQLKEEAKKDVYGLTKPKLRGLIHAWSVLPFLFAGILLTASTDSALARWGVAVYTISITAMLTASAAYHRLEVSLPTRALLRRIDHAMIGVAVAGSYTPIAILVTGGAELRLLLGLLWGGAIGGLVLALAKPGAPRWMRASLYIALGWAGLFIFPELIRKGGVDAFVFVAIGGLLYSAGAFVYGKRRPNPLPSTFGFHELFHTLVVAAVIMQFIAITLVVSRLG